jgi:hypothetical protein
MEPAAISLDDTFSIVSCLHRSTDNDIAVTAEHVHVPSVPAAPAEEVELFGLRPPQHHKMPALGDDVLVVDQGPRTIAGAIDHDVLVARHPCRDADPT